jgi:hypothetical protein
MFLFWYLIPVIELAVFHIQHITLMQLNYKVNCKEDWYLFFLLQSKSELKFVCYVNEV